MSNVTPSPTDGRQIPPRRRSSLWAWFVAGFLIVLILFAVAWPVYRFNGRGLQQTKIWYYYVLEIPRLFRAQPLGTGSGNAVVSVAFQHLLISIAGGAVASGIGWALRRPSRPT